jgi:hypothetical protein
MGVPRPARVPLACASLLVCLLGAPQPTLAESRAVVASASVDPGGTAEPLTADPAPPGASGRLPLAGPPAPPQRTSVLLSDGDRARRPSRLDATLVGAGQVADIVTTELALARPGLREGNPLVRERAVRIGLKTGVTLGLTLACNKLRQRAKPRHARLLAVLGFSVGAAAAVHNVRMMGK